MVKRLVIYNSPFPRVLFIPAAALLVGVIASLFLPQTDIFDFIRGCFLGMFGVVTIATVGGVVGWRRQRRILAENAALENLEPLRPSTEFGER